MNTADQNIQSEKQLVEILTKQIEHFTAAAKLIETEMKNLEKKQQSFPLKYLEKANEGNYEDLLIQASQLKHKSISLHRNVSGIEVSLDTEIGYFEAQILLYFAEFFLKDKGFDKVTDLLRNSYLKSSKELKKLKNLQGKILANKKASEQLVRAFESDEVNFRKFLDMKNKLRGL